MSKHILETKIQDQTVEEWINYFSIYSKKTKLRVYYNSDDFFGIECCFDYREEKSNHKTNHINIFKTVFYGSVDDFELFINSFKFFGTIYRTS